MINVFISHNNKDKLTARTLAKKLNQYGIQTWIDEAEIQVGDSLITKIREGLDKVDYLLALISEHSVKSEWVTKELDIAMNREIDEKKIIVVPVLIGRCELPGFLKGKLYADMTTRRKLNDNFPLLLSRFQVEYIEEEIKETFTKRGLAASNIIERLENGTEFERIFILESIRKEDSDLFKIEPFLDCLNYLVSSEKENVALLLSVLEACKFCPYTLNAKLNFLFLSLMECENDEIRIQTLEVVYYKDTFKLFYKKVLKLLQSDSSESLTAAILKYLLGQNLDSYAAEKLCRFCKGLIDEHSSQNNEILLEILCKYIDTYYTEETIKLVCRNYNLIDNRQNKNIISSFFYYCRYTEFLFIHSPKVRDEFKSFLIQSISDDENINSNIGLFLLFDDNNLGYSRHEVWEIINRFDDFSLEMLFEELTTEYRVKSVLSSKEDVDEVTKLLSRNTNVKKLVNEILSEIQ